MIVEIYIHILVYEKFWSENVWFWVKQLNNPKCMKAYCLEKFIHSLFIIVYKTGNIVKKKLYFTLYNVMPMSIYFQK